MPSHQAIAKSSLVDVLSAVILQRSLMKTWMLIRPPFVRNAQPPGSSHRTKCRFPAMLMKRRHPMKRKTCSRICQAKPCLSPCCKIATRDACLQTSGAKALRGILVSCEHEALLLPVDLRQHLGPALRLDVASLLIEDLQRQARLHEGLELFADFLAWQGLLQPRDQPRDQEEGSRIRTKSEPWVSTARQPAEDRAAVADG